MRLAAVLFAAALSGASAGERELDLLKVWIAAVDQHRAGESDPALKSLSVWTYSDLELMRPYIEALAVAPAESNRDRARRRSTLSTIELAAIRAMTKELGDAAEFARHAAVLHTDAAMLAPPPAVAMIPVAAQQQPRWARQPSDRDIIVNSYDGQFQSYQLKNPHWGLAMDLLDALPRGDVMVADWYRAVGAYFARERRFAEALQHFERARQAVPDNPDVLYGEACLHETLGAPRIQNYVRVTTLPNGRYIRGVDSREAEWRRAEGLLRRALALNPNFVEARLRLSRVLIQSGKPAEGLPLAEQAAADAIDRTVRYYARLFAGDALSAMNRHGAARDSYQHAVDLYPDAQAARLGLASAMRAAGDADAAIAALLPSITRPPENRAADDPWWDYYDGDATQVETLLADLREPFRSPRR